MSRIKKGFAHLGRTFANIPIPDLPEWVEAHKPEGMRRVYGPPVGNPYAGQTIMIIGAVGALGHAVAYQFVRHGAEHIYLTGDRLNELVHLKNYLRNHPVLQYYNSNYTLELCQLDLSNRTMTRNFVDIIVRSCTSLHVLLFNAATFCQNFQACAGPDPQSHASERMMQVNCYSQFLIFMALRPALRNAGVSSNSPSHATFVTCRWLRNEYGKSLPVTFDRLRAHLANPAHFKNGRHFHLTKLLTTFWIYYYAHLASVNDTRVIVNTVWPGTLRRSSLYRDWGPGVHQAIEEARALLGRSSKKAARVVHAATLGHARTHGDCLADNTKYLGKDLVMEHAKLGCERLVYGMLLEIMQAEFGAMPVGIHPVPPDDPLAGQAIVSDPWDRFQ